MLGLRPAQPDPHDAAIAVLDRVTHHRERLVEAVDARDVRRQPDLDPVPLARFVGPVADAAEDEVAVESAPETEREDRLQVDGAVLDSLLCVLDHDLPEVLGTFECARSEHEDLDEMREVAVLVQRPELVDRVDGQLIAVPARDLEQGLRPHRPLEVDVELDLWKRHDASVGASSRVP
jgi:hypothetical protein